MGSVFPAMQEMRLCRLFINKLARLMHRLSYKLILPLRRCTNYSPDLETQVTEMNDIKASLIRYTALTLDYIEV